jgi:hypothetical protein
MKSFSLLASLCLWGSIAFCQSHDSVDFKKIKEVKVRKLLLKNNILNRSDFGNVKELCAEKEDPTFSRHVVSYLIPRSPEEVWDAYLNLAPNKSWSGTMATFGVLYDLEEKPLIYADGSSSKLAPGQVFFVQLTLLKGYFKMAVANKVMEVNDDKKEFKVCYLSSGASEGSQYIRVTKTPEGFAKVEHESFFRSKSKFRDKRLYPKIHEKIIAEYHANVAASMDCGLAGL